MTYVTTSIAYINAEPHIGFLLELVASDIIARQARLAGQDTFFLTGTDEHGIKIQQAIELSGKSPQVYADELAGKFQQLSTDFNISNDFFIRTTDPAHIEFVKEIWQRLQQAGVLEKKAYVGYYCTGCEAFKTEREIVDGRCSIHERPVEKVEEENYFLKLSAEAKAKIKDWIKTAVYPATKQAEAINWLESGAFDEVSVSRPKEKLWWGIGVPGDENQVMYVWVDALFNYLSALKIAGRSVTTDWPADYQIVGKDIMKFHVIIWPALLLATGYQLPKQILVHGFVNVDGKKMSKSLGNVITPAQLLERYGAEATRYLLMRQLNFYDDSNFVWKEMDNVYNGELANGLGNLLSRCVGLAKRSGIELPGEVDEAVQTQSLDFQQELTEANRLITEADKLVTTHQLWVDTASKADQLKAVGQTLLKVASLLEPYLPVTAEKIRTALQQRQTEPLFKRLQDGS